MDRNSFSQFCESLAMNKTLKDLDLRNNQITHTSALELCSVIEINASLRTLGNFYVRFLKFLFRLFILNLN
jgi:hypothetical protein